MSTSIPHVTAPYPVLFVGHGSPMNVLSDNGCEAAWRAMGTDLPLPQAILCISAHWETAGTRITVSPQPVTMHDFGGFPPPLYTIQYPVPGHPKLAQQIITAAHDAGLAIQPDAHRGLDHGVWCVLRSLFPAAQVPVLQLSIDYTATPQQHVAVAQVLQSLRAEGVLFVASGNIVHNLSMLDWESLDTPMAYPWAVRAHGYITQAIQQRDFEALYQALSPQAPRYLRHAIPTADHLLPLLYALGLTHADDRLSIHTDTIIGGALDMTSFAWGI